MLNCATEDAPHKITPRWNENTTTLKNYENHLQSSLLGNKPCDMHHLWQKKLLVLHKIYTLVDREEKSFPEEVEENSVHRVLIKYIVNIPPIINFVLCTSCFYDHNFIIYSITFVLQC